MSGREPDAAGGPPDRLTSADPQVWPVAPGWQPLVDDFFRSAPGQALCRFLDQRLQAGATIFPPEPLRALQLTPPEQVRVVILGQDPYHGRGQAEGLAFSVRPGVPLPPSLRNIFKELERDLGVPRPDHGCLESWAKQGVLLLNSVLTVEAGNAGSHQGKGWEGFTDEVISAIDREHEHVVFLLWGAYAQKKGQRIDTAKHCVLRSVHPSPLSAHRGFIGCGHFSAANAYLREHGRTPIEWALSPR